MRSAAIKLSFTFSYKLIGKVSPFILQYKSMLKVLCFLLSTVGMFLDLRLFTDFESRKIMKNFAW